jgi:predicted GIY-YIG superfamily endonuclease
MAKGDKPVNKMFYVYLIQSESHPDRRYIGCTRNLKDRLQRHNAGRSSHTAQYTPWKLVTYHAFSDKLKAQEFERYLKSGSGQAFARKRFW